MFSYGSRLNILTRKLSTYSYFDTYYLIPIEYEFLLNTQGLMYN